MTFGKVVDNQFTICNWIRKNLKPSKCIPSGYSSMYLLRIIQKEIPEITHEEFKQAMARCGFFGDCSLCDEHYSKVFFNVKISSIKKAERSIKKC